jgi:hypothetical protein
VDVIFRNFTDQPRLSITLLAVGVIIRIGTDQILNITVLRMEMPFRNGTQQLLAGNIAVIIMCMRFRFRNFAKHISFFPEIAGITVVVQDGSLCPCGSIAGLLMNMTNTFRQQAN